MIEGGDSISRTAKSLVRTARLSARRLAGNAAPSGILRITPLCAENTRGKLGSPIRLSLDGFEKEDRIITLPD